MKKCLLKDIIGRYETASFFINRRLNAMIRELMPADLTTDQVATLRSIRSQEKMTSSELSDIFCVGKSSITAIVNRLFDKNLIRRIPDSNDRRVTYLALTNEGTQVCDAMEEKIQNLLEKYIKNFDEQEALSFIETFEKLASNLKHGEVNQFENGTEI